MDRQELQRLQKARSAKLVAYNSIVNHLHESVGINLDQPEQSEIDTKFSAMDMLRFQTWQSTANTLRREIEAVTKDIDRIARRLVIQKRKDNPSAMSRWMKQGREGLSQPEQVESDRLGKALGFNSKDSFTTPMVSRAIDAPDQDTDGGRLTDDTTIQGVIDALSNYGGILNAVTTVTTRSGNSLKYPFADDGTTSGALLSNLTTTPTETPLPAFDTLTFEAFPVDTGFTQVSRYFDEDIDWDIGEYTKRLLMRRIGRTIEYQATLGTGSIALNVARSSPSGITANVSTINKTGNNTNIDWRDLVGLIHSIDPAWLRGEQGLYGYRHKPGSVGFLVNWKFLGRLLQVQDAESRPLILPNLIGDYEVDDTLEHVIDANRTLSQYMKSKVLFGYPIHVAYAMEGESSENALYPSVWTPGTTPIIFGNFGYFAVRIANPQLMIEEHYDSATAKEYYRLYIGRTRMDCRPICQLDGNGNPVAWKGLTRPVV